MKALLGSKLIDKVPVACVNQTVTIEQIKRLDVHFPSAHIDPEKMAKLSIGAVEILGLDNVRVPFCQTVEAEALGCKVNLGDDNNLPAVVSHPYKLDEPPLELPEGFLSRGRVPVVIEATRRLAKNVGDEVAVISGIVGPFSIAGYLLGLNELLISTLSDPESLKPFLELGVKIGILYGNALTEAGASVICVEDMSASTDMISPQTYRDLVLPYHKRLFDALNRGITVLHICGDVTPIVSYMADSGADALSIDHKLNLSKAIEVKDRVTLVGNLDPVGRLLQGRPEDIIKTANESLANGIDVLAPGCSLALGTPTENVIALKSIELPKTQVSRLAYKPVDVFTRYDLYREGKESSKRSVSNILDEVREAVVLGNGEKVKETVKKALDVYPPLDVINKGLVEGMNIVSELWNNGEYFLPQVIISADALQNGMKLCEEKMGHTLEKKGRIVMHVAEGDVHTIGKDIVKSLLIAHGYEVIDLGVDVPVERVIEAVKEYKPCLLTGSALMTTTMSAFPKIAKRLEEEGIEIPFACGGGAVNQEFCEGFKFGIYGGKAVNGPLIADAASSGKSWQEIRKAFHR
ncbi:MAG: MtaA/CmuA family methyltransferase [bacterium]